MTTRHLYRAPYSINEKSELVSVPIKPEESEIMNFKKEMAKPDVVRTDVPFLSGDFIGEEAFDFLETAMYEAGKKIAISSDRKRNKGSESPGGLRIKKRSGKIPPEMFPPCILNILKGLEDGRKRAEFVLRTFLSNMGWNWDEIKVFIMKWNKNNGKPLPENYLLSHIEWHRKQTRNLLPPACANPTYYRSMGVCQPDAICKNIKNPIAYPRMLEIRDGTDVRGKNKDNLRDSKRVKKE